MKINTIMMVLKSMKEKGYCHWVGEVEWIIGLGLICSVYGPTHIFSLFNKNRGSLLRTHKCLLHTKIYSRSLPCPKIKQNKELHPDYLSAQMFYDPLINLSSPNWKFFQTYRIAN